MQNPSRSERIEMRAFIAIIAIVILSGCGKPTGIATLERTSDTGLVSVEMESSASYDRDDLPPGVEPKEVVSVVPVTVDVDESTSEDQSAPVAKKKVSGHLYVLDNGNVVADKSISNAIGKPETIEPSYKWLWLFLVLLVVLVIVAWAVERIFLIAGPVGKVVSFFAGIFKRR